MDGCYYISAWGWAFGWTQQIPILISLIAFVITAYTKEPLYFLFSWFLWIPQITIWTFQAYFQMVMPDPICQAYHTYAFPSVTAFYVGVVVVTFFAVALLWEIEHSWVNWLIMMMFGIVPPLILIWFGYNRWWEVLFSLGYGALFGLGFAFVLRYLIQPVMPYLEFHFPLFTFGYEDRICMTEEERSQRDRIREAILRYSRM